MSRSGRSALLGLLAATVLVVAAIDADARAGSGGSRGSRSYTAPAPPVSPVAPTTPEPTSTAMSSPSEPGAAGGVGRGLGGLLVGGLIGGLLFGHHQGPGIGVLDVQLIAGGLGHIRALDPRSDPTAFAETARAVFCEVQDRVGARDLAPLRGRLTREMRGILAGQVDQARSARRTSRVEDVRFAGVEVTEAWQEAGGDFVTVYLTGPLLDYTLDDATRQIVEGSRTTPQAFEEFWTFTRPVGRNGWQLSAIQGV